jgi:Arc/MetJ-type ribon-helix-helix transcriptional regulator
MHRFHSHLRHRSRSSARETDAPERDTTRVQLEMPPQAMERLQRLKERTEATSYAEVVRNALRIFEALAGEQEKGAELMLRKSNGELVAYKLFV